MAKTDKYTRKQMEAMYWVAIDEGRIYQRMDDQGEKKKIPMMDPYCIGRFDEILKGKTFRVRKPAKKRGQAGKE